MPVKQVDRYNDLFNFAQSFDNNEANPKFSYNEFLRTVEKNLSKIKDPETVSTERRNIVAGKIKELTKEHVAKKESKFSFITKFFDKLSQKIHGHGFQTKSQWAMKLAAELEKVDFNSLDDATFESHLRKEFFGVNSLPKYKFFENLSEEKQEVLLTVMFNRDDWYDQMFELLRVTPKVNFMEFLSEGFAAEHLQARFLDNPKLFMDIQAKKDVKLDTRQKGVNHDIFSMVLEVMIRDKLENGDYDFLTALVHNHSISYKATALNPLILTSDELDDLQNNVAVGFREFIL